MRLSEAEEGEEMHKEIRIEARVRNNVLWQAIFSKWRSVNAFCKEKGFAPSQVGDLLNLKSAPLTAHGEYREFCKRLAQVLGQIPEDLFPLPLYRLERTRAAIEVGFAELPAGGRELLQIPSATTPFDCVVEQEMKEAVREALHVLAPREEKVLRMRFGFDEEQGEYTLNQIADVLKVSPERVRSVEVRALRRLRHPMRSKVLIKHL